MDVSQEKTNVRLRPCLPAGRFDRQKPIDNFIVDFYCKELKLAIEIDGESHYGKENKDAKRDRRLKGLGITVLRFDDLDVRYNLEKVVGNIENWIENQKK